MLYKLVQWQGCAKQIRTILLRKIFILFLENKNILLFQKRNYIAIYMRVAILAVREKFSQEEY